MRLTLKFWKWFKSSPDSDDISQMIVPEEVATEKGLAKRVIKYKDPEITKFVQKVPFYINKNSHELGDLVRLRNNALALITDVNGRKFPLIISPYRQDLASLLDKLNLIREHQLLINAEWPSQDDPRFREKLMKIFVSFGFQPEGKNIVDPTACYTQKENIVLKYYQKIVSTYAIYGPYRGVLVVHSMGTGKTCTAIAAIDNFLAFRKLEQETANRVDPIKDPVKIQTLTTAAAEVKEPIDAPKRHVPVKASKPPKAAEVSAVVKGIATASSIASKTFQRPEIKGGAPRAPAQVYVVIPPRANLEQNFRSELTRCPSKIKEMILAQREKGGKMDPGMAVNRIINQNINIISYVSLSNRLKKGILSIENSLLILDEAHNFLEPPKQYAAAYNHLYSAIMKTKECKLLLLTGTPIYKSVTDLPRLLNLLRRENETKFPETEDAFFKKYFTTGGKIDSRRFINDIKGYVSYYDAEGDLSYFAKKVETLPIITHVTDDHYKRWLESRKTENKSYGFGDKIPPVEELVLSKNAKFKSPVSGYFKRSSAMTNLPISYRKHDKWPAKLAALADVLAKHPHEKHFIFSRHAAQGANAIGEYLEQELGWERMSNNRNDHGTHAPQNFNPLSRELVALKNKKLEPEVYKAAKQQLIKQHLKKPYYGFVVANKGTSQREIGYDKEIFNDIEDNVDGKLCRVFIADETFSEGLSLLNCSHVHLLEPVYSLQAYRQIIARAVRNCSHKQLRFPWSVSIHKYLADLDEEHETTDGILTQYSAAAQAVLQQLIDTMQAGSIEAGFDTLHRSTAEIKPKMTLWQRLLNLVKRKPTEKLTPVA